jgi:hypothetical protein
MQAEEVWLGLFMYHKFNINNFFAVDLCNSYFTVRRKSLRLVLYLTDICWRSSAKDDLP